jgi:hypothetical protein
MIPSPIITIKKKGTEEAVLCELSSACKNIEPNAYFLRRISAFYFFYAIVFVAPSSMQGARRRNFER